MPFTYSRTVRFQDTDAAGVVYFANVLAMCHEAYEESLVAVDIDLRLFFSNPSVAIPLVHASVDFLHPLFSGDRLVIRLLPQSLDGESFKVAYEVRIEMVDKSAARAVTRHVCIDPTVRTRKALPDEMIRWLGRWGG